MVACCYQHRGRSFVSKRDTGIRGRVPEPELRFDMVGAQGGLIYNGPKLDRSAQMRQQHRPSKIAGANNVDAVDRV